MGRVKVLTHDGKMILADKAVEDVAFMCPWTKKIFAKEENYLNHLHNIRRQIRLKNNNNRVDIRLGELWNDCQSFDEVISWVNSNQAIIYDKCIANEIWIDESVAKFRFEIETFKAKFTPQIRCTHSAPIGESINFANNPAFPLAFPGWRGSLTTILSPKKNSATSDMVAKFLRFHAASLQKAYGDQKIITYSDLTMWEDDWPGLREANIMHKISGNIDVEYKKDKLTK